MLTFQYLPDCDLVILMRDGQIAENGSHAQLMAKARDYASLFTNMQQEVRRGSAGGVGLVLNKARLHNNTLHYMLNYALALKGKARSREMLMHTQPFIMYARIDFTHVLLPKTNVLI